MWDISVLEKVEECAGGSRLSVFSETSKINFLGLLWMFIAPILMLIEGSYGTNWLVCLAGGTCLGAMGGFQRFSLS